MTIDPYEKFADRYDLFFTRHGEHGEAETGFYRRLFKDYDVQRVLDCACGTGHDLVMFHDLVCQVEGSDISDAMLNRAKKNLETRGLSIPLKKADYRQLSEMYDDKFDAVMCLSSSICQMENETELMTAFRSMLSVLRPGGIVVLTQGTTDKQWNSKPRFIPVINNEKYSRLFVIDYFEKGARYHVLDLFHSIDNRDFKVWSIDYNWMILSDDYKQYLHMSGFTDIKLYGSYQFDPYDLQSSDILIIVAQK